MTEGIQEKLVSFHKEKGGCLFANDQDTINGVLKGRIKPLMPRYNFFTNYRYFSYRELVSLSGTYLAVSEEELKLAKHHPFIVHYMGDERPWIAGNRESLPDEPMSSIWSRLRGVDYAKGKRKKTVYGSLSCHELSDCGVPESQTDDQPQVWYECCECKETIRRGNDKE